MVPTAVCSGCWRGYTYWRGCLIVVLSTARDAALAAARAARRGVGRLLGRAGAGVRASAVLAPPPSPGGRGRGAARLRHPLRADIQRGVDAAGGRGGRGGRSRGRRAGRRRRAAAPAASLARGARRAASADHRGGAARGRRRLRGCECAAAAHAPPVRPPSLLTRLRTAHDAEQTQALLGPGGPVRAAFEGGAAAGAAASACDALLRLRTRLATGVAYFADPSSAKLLPDLPPAAASYTRTLGAPPLSPFPAPLPRSCPPPTHARMRAPPPSPPS